MNTFDFLCYYIHIRSGQICSPLLVQGDGQYCNVVLLCESLGTCSYWYGGPQHLHYYRLRRNCVCVCWWQWCCKTADFFFYVNCANYTCYTVQMDITYTRSTRSQRWLTCSAERIGRRTSPPGSHTSLVCTPLTSSERGSTSSASTFMHQEPKETTQCFCAIDIK